MNDELAILRKLAANPYDRGTLGAYADWLREQGRHDEEAAVRQSLNVRKPGDVNSITVGELVAILLEMPLDAPVIYRYHSGWTELAAEEVTLHRSEDKRIVWREQNGYGGYYSAWQTPAEAPNFVTVCCLPGN